MIKEFSISARQYVKGMSIHAELTVVVNPPQTEDYMTLAAAAQIELRTLLRQTFDQQLKTREMLDREELRETGKVGRGKSQPRNAKPSVRGRKAVLRGKANRPRKAKSVPAKNDGRTQAEAQE
jgi:hypothetical protein